MISLRGPKLKFFASILAVIALCVGIYTTFFQSQGFVKTTGTVVSVWTRQKNIGRRGSLL